MILRSALTHARLSAAMHPLRAAQVALRDLVESEAPPSVIAAAERLIECVKAGKRPPAELQDILLGYASRERQQQNRYGK